MNANRTVINAAMSAQYEEQAQMQATRTAKISQSLTARDKTEMQFLSASQHENY